jgi:hypothetical protein
VSGGTGWSQGLTIAITTVVSIWMMRAMVAAGKKQAAQAADGAFELRYPRWYSWAGVACALIGTVMATLGGFATAKEGIGALILVLGVGGAMAVGGAWMALETLRRVVRVHVDRVESFDLRDRRSEVRWDAVKEVRFRSVAGYLVLEGNDGTTIQASLALVGLQSLVDQLKKSVPASRWTAALKQLEEYRQKQG